MQNRIVADAEQPRQEVRTGVAEREPDTIRAMNVKATNQGQRSAKGRLEAPPVVTSPLAAWPVPSGGRSSLLSCGCGGHTGNPVPRRFRRRRRGPR